MNARRERESAAPQPNESRFVTWAVLAMAVIVTGVTVYVWVGADRSSPPPPEPTGPTPAEEVLNHARPLVEAGMLVPAADLMRAYVRANPGDVEVRPLLGETQLRLGRLARAERTIETLLRLAPQMPRALWLRGELARRRGESEAMEYFRQAAESPLATPEFRARFGRELLAAGEIDRARQWLAEAYDAGVRDPDTLGGLGAAALEAGRCERALELLEEALDKAPADAAHRAMLAEALLKLDRGERARRVLSGGLEIRREGRLLEMLGDILAEREQHAEAADLYAEAADFPVVRFAAAVKAAENYYRIGRYAEAMHCIDRAAEIDGDDERVRTLLRRIEDARFGPADRAGAPSGPENHQGEAPGGDRQ